LHAGSGYNRSMSGQTLLFTFLAAALLSLIATRLVLAWLRRRAIYDLPNDRSSHTVATPRGGGIGVMIALLIAGGGIVFSQLSDSPDLARGLAGILMLATVLGIVSWADDLYGLSAAPRFFAQLVAVAAGIALLPENAPVFQGLLPVWADHLVAGFAWMWFINLTNFMDGTDGLTALETSSVGAGLAIIFGLVLTNSGLAPLALTGAALAGVSLGFFAWNRPPASVFMGDVGAIPLGFVMGWALLAAASQGFLAVGLILPLYYVSDASVTLIKRAVRREKILQAHRSHFYQQAARALEGPEGRKRTRAHWHLLIVILLCNVILIDMAATAAAVPAQTILLSVTAALVVVALLWYLATRKPDHDA
jgi:UDP-N-acetylmuramyl pentapeptide phosphotransferase/UDP-N-acetylglucosamine-1-phosphate transferase